MSSSVTEKEEQTSIGQFTRWLFVACHGQSIFRWQFRITRRRFQRNGIAIQWSRQRGALHSLVDRAQQKVPARLRLYAVPLVDESQQVVERDRQGDATTRRQSGGAGHRVENRAHGSAARRRHVGCSLQRLSYLRTPYHMGFVKLFRNKHYLLTLGLFLIRIGSARVDSAPWKAQKLNFCNPS